MLYEVAILETPTKKEAEEGKTERLVFGPRAVIANDPQSAGIAAVLDDNNGDKIDEWTERAVNGTNDDSQRDGGKFHCHWILLVHLLYPFSLQHMGFKICSFLVELAPFKSCTTGIHLRSHLFVNILILNDFYQKIN